MKAINFYVVVEKIKEAPKKVGGLELTEDQNKDVRYLKGKVISAGPQADVLSKDDIVHYDKHAGHKIEIKENISLQSLHSFGCNEKANYFAKIDSNEAIEQRIQWAKEKNIPLIVLAGSLGEGYQTLYEKVFDGIFSIIDKPMSLQEAIDNAGVLLENAAETVIRLWTRTKS